MNWTDNKPTVPGWYWLKQKQKVQIVNITIGPGVVFRVGSLCGTRLSMNHGQWAGPLEPPT